MNIAIIPARGGSTRVARKNIKLFRGRPMIDYAISAAKASGLFAHIVVSTDDEEIATIARDCGAETPFVRPSHLADDFTATAPVIAHAVDACRDQGWSFKQVCCIYPAAPFLREEDLHGALALLSESNVDFSFPITTFPSAIQRALKRNKNKETSPFYPEFETTRSQDLAPAYYDAGQFYWGKAEAWLQDHVKIHSNGVGFVIPNWRVVDIDTPEDWLRAEAIYDSVVSLKG